MSIWQADQYSMTPMSKRFGNSVKEKNSVLQEERDQTQAQGGPAIFREWLGVKEGKQQ